MIEILISLLLLSMLFLGFDATQVTLLETSLANYYSFIAENEIHAIQEELRIKKGHFNESMISRWQQQCEILLPQGKVTVVIKFPYVEVSVWWGGALSSCSQIKLGKSGCLKSMIKI